MKCASKMIMLPCPHCHRTDAPVTYSFPTGAFTCAKCKETFTIELIRDLLDGWGGILEVWDRLPFDDE